MIKHIALRNYRNAEYKELEFSKGINIIVGDNGAGKTNIIEAINLATYGTSFRTTFDKEIIKEDENVANILATDFEGNEFFVGIERGYGNRSKKLFKVNDKKTSVSNFVASSFPSVVFSPTDIEIITGSNSKRRDYMDKAIILQDKSYKKVLSEFKKIIASRNRILKNIREGLSQKPELEFYNQKLISLSNVIQKKRKIFVDHLQGNTKKAFAEISNTRADLNLEYISQEVTNQSLKDYEEIEIAAKRTLLGAHRDNLEIQFKKEGTKYSDTRYYASRGEQRTIIFTLKLLAIDYIKVNQKKEVIILLDDIYSELDKTHREKITKVIKSSQTIITLAEENLIPKDIGDFNLIKIQ